MNGFNHIKRSHSFFNKGTTPITDFVYMVIIATIDGEGSKVYSSVVVSQLKQRLRHCLTNEQITDALNTLVEDGLIKLKRGEDIEVGFFNGDGDVCFYDTSEKTVSPLYDKLISSAVSFRDSSESLRASSLAANCIHELKKYKEKSPESIHDFVSLFGSAYSTVMQSSFPKAMDKEYGQMKNLHKRYGEQLDTLILHFVCYFEKWCSTLSIGNLSYFKDDVYADMLGKQAVKNKQRNESDF